MSSARTPKTRQLTLDLKSPRKHGGRRAGAGRPKTSRLQPHVARGKFKAREPVHVTIRLLGGLPSLRRKDVFGALKAAVRKARARGLSVIHFAILGNHAHLIVESVDHRALSRQMQSFGVSLAKRVHALAGRTGQVFRERYHPHVLRTPLEVKNALRYVLTNEFRHEGQNGRVRLGAYSSALLVSDESWAALLGRSWRRIVDFPPWEEAEGDSSLREDIGEWVQAPAAWLLRVGWQRA